MVHKLDNTDLEIILNLINDNFHVRQLSKEINIPHSTMGRKLIQLRNNNIIDYKQEGKNKTYFLKKNLISKNAVFCAEHYKLMKILKKHPSLNIIFEEILKNSKEKLIVLFGSYAKFASKPTSDIDIYVNSTETHIKKKIENINYKINVKIGEFDLNNFLIKEIIKNHVIIKGVEYYYEKNRFFN